MLIERDVAESIHYIQTAVTRLSGIIDALLRLSRAGRVEYRPKLSRIAAHRFPASSEAMRGTIAGRKAEITVLDNAPVWADPTAIEQIFANLIGNAVNYLDPSRPGKIEIGMTEREVDDMEHPLTYYVKDNGLGIADAYLPKVFGQKQGFHGSAVATGQRESDWRSSAAWWNGTAARSGWSPSREPVPPFSSHFRQRPSFLH